MVTAHRHPQSLSSNEPTSIDAETPGPHCRPVDAVFPDAEVDTEVAEPDTLEPESPTDRPRCRHRACNTRAAIITFNVTDFAVAHLKEHLPIGVIHEDDFIMEWSISTRSVPSPHSASCGRDKKNPPWGGG